VAEGAHDAATARAQQAGKLIAGVDHRGTGQGRDHRDTVAPTT
jgi:hypothetical protein